MNNPEQFDNYEQDEQNEQAEEKEEAEDIESESWNRFTNMLSWAFEASKDSAKSIVDSTREWLSNTRDSVSDSFSNVRESISDTSSSVKDRIDSFLNPNSWETFGWEWLAWWAANAIDNRREQLETAANW